MYFKIQHDQPRITQNALKSQIFDLFIKSLSGHKKTKAKNLEFMKVLLKLFVIVVQICS